MSEYSIPMELLLTVDQSVAKRAERLQFASELLQRKHPESEVRKRVQKRFDCSQSTAWRAVSVAKDIT